MNSSSDIVRFLSREDQLRLGDSPRGDVDRGDYDFFPVDWGTLLNDEWMPQVDDGELDDLAGTIGTAWSRPGRAGSESSWGWDICAWYQPIHFFGHEWGIFVREECIRSLVFRIAESLDTNAISVPLQSLYRDLIRAAFFCYFLHEQFHHKVESFGIRLLVVEKSGRYLPYMSSVYGPTFGTDDNSEEALANADAFRRLNTQPYRRILGSVMLEATRDAFQEAIESSPPGYRLAVEYFPDAQYAAGEYELQASVQQATVSPTESARFMFAPRLVQSFFSIRDNIYTVVPPNQRPMLPVRGVAPIRTVSTRAVKKYLKALGYREVQGGKGSHIKMKKDGFPTLILPARRDHISPGIARNIADALGLNGLDGLRQAVA